MEKQCSKCCCQKKKLVQITINLDHKIEETKIEKVLKNTEGVEGYSLNKEQLIVYYDDILTREEVIKKRLKSIK